MTTTNTNLTSELVNGERWVECTCGAGEYLPKQLRHRRSCKTSAQWTQVDASIQRFAAIELHEVIVSNDLNAFADDVRRTGLTKGRTEDLVEAVRTKRLSQNDAMNSDD